MMSNTDEAFEDAPIAAEEGWSPGEMQETLRRRRSAVIKHIEMHAKAGVLAELVFDLLVHLALNPESAVDDSLIESFAWRHEIDPDEAYIRLLDGQRVAIPDALKDTRRAATVELVNALLALGFAQKLAPLEESDRRSFTMRVVGLLPGIERIGPFVISDYVDQACSEEDAHRFWSTYTDRVAAEINKRGVVASEEANPWLLPKLLAVHAKGPLEGRGRAWLTLKQHVKRVLRINRHRWRYIRILAEGCQDPNILHYIVSSPAVSQDPEVLYVFLTRGDEQLISFALFALQVRAQRDDAVVRVLDFFASRPLPEIAHRVTEIYAQASWPQQPSAALEQLKKGILGLIGEKMGPNVSLDSLQQALSGDTRGFRQCALICDLASHPAIAAHHGGRPLLEGVFGAFLKTFTPAGVDHPLNDEIYRAYMRKLIAALMDLGGQKFREKIDRFGFELAGHVERWTGETAPSSIKRKLLNRFAAVYAQVLFPLARTLYADEERKDLGRSLYRTLVRIYIEHRDSIDGQTAFGSLEYCFNDLFPELAKLSLDQIDIGRLIDVSHVIARLDQDLLEEGTSDGEDVEWSRSAVPTLSLLTNRPERNSPLIAQVKMLERRQSISGSIFRAYLGFDLLASLAEKVRGLMGLKRTGEITLTDREVVITSERTMGERVVERTGDSHALEDLVAVNIKQRFRSFYFALGLLGMVSSTLLGGHLLFIGLRGSDPTLAGLGVAMIIFGLFFDATMSRISEVNRDNVLVDLKFNSHPRHYSMLFSRVEGAEVLDAFMAFDAQRRELAMLEGNLPALGESWPTFDEFTTEKSLARTELAD